MNKKLIIQEKLFLILKKKIDIVILNDAYPLLEYRILKEGKLIYSIAEKKELIMRPKQL